MLQHIQQYISNGYSAILANTSNIGSHLLSNGHRVVKFGQDPSYADYVCFVLSQRSPFSFFPVIYSHALPLGPFSQSSNAPYTVTEMEVLQALSHQEKASYEAWISAELATIGRGGNASSDPFGLELGIYLLVMNAQPKNIGLDLLKGDNIMKRAQNEYVITDPYS